MKKKEYRFNVSIIGKVKVRAETSENAQFLVSELRLLAKGVEVERFEMKYSIEGKEPR